jgi:hypothetical protein
MEENPYQPPNFSDPPEIEGSSPRELEYRAFVGRNARYYLRKWSFAPDDSGSTRGFNWAAFLLSGLWIPYRKMYRATFIFYSILVGTSVLAELAAYAGVASENALSALDQFGGVIASVVCGIFGNAWYLAHAKREIAKIRDLSLDNQAYLKALAKRGGTNLPAAFGMFVLFIAAIFAVMFILAIVLDVTPLDAE